MVKVGEGACAITKEMFRFKQYEDLFALANQNAELPDVIGRLYLIKDCRNDIISSTQRIVLRLVMSGCLEINVTVWDQKAVIYEQSWRMQVNNRLLFWSQA